MGEGGCSPHWFLHSWGWQLGKHSAVYNSAYVHFSWGLWVSEKGCSLCLCPKRQHESQLYGNGCQWGGGALPNRCLNQSHSAQMLKIREACLLSSPLHPDSQDHCAVTPRAGLGPPGSASRSFCRPAHPLAQWSSPKGSSCHSRHFPLLLPSGRGASDLVCRARKVPWGAECGWHVCESLLCILRAGTSWMSDSLVLSRIEKLTNIWPWFFLSSGTQGPTISPPLRAPSVCLEDTVFRTNCTYSSLILKCTVNCAHFPPLENEDVIRGPSNSNPRIQNDRSPPPRLPLNLLSLLWEESYLLI